MRPTTAQGTDIPPGTVTSGRWTHALRPSFAAQKRKGERPRSWEVLLFSAPMTDRLVECSDMGPLACSGIPHPQCFGKPPGWKFSVSRSNPHWRRALTAHENAHLEHMWSAETFMAQARLVRNDAGKTWICQLCSASLSALHKALDHRCRQVHVTVYVLL